MVSELHYLPTSKSRYITGKKCGRRRYYSNVFGGHGIRPTSQAEALGLGAAWHEGMERILLKGEDYGVVAQEIGQSIATTLKTNAKKLWGEEDPNLEWARWIEGMIYAAGKYILPEILAEYAIVGVEIETEFTLPPVWGDEGDQPFPPVKLIGRPDLILKRKVDGTYWYWEWKTTGWMDTRWLRQWDKDIQLQGAARAIEATLGLKIEGCVVQGVYKGFKKDQHLNHPFVYAYSSPSKILGVQGQWNVKWTKGWEKTPTDEFEGGLFAWVDYLWDNDQEAVRGLFPRTLPISINDRLVKSYFRQLWFEEQRYHTAENNPSLEGPEDMLDLYYPQHFWECEPSIGMRCEYLDCCWNPEVEKDPVGSGLFEAKEPRVVESEKESDAV